VPERQMFAALRWAPGGLRGANVTIEAQHVSRIEVDDENSDHAPSRTLFNLRLGYEAALRDWSFGAYVRVNNIFDRDYAGSVIVNEANRRFFEPAPGRNWMLGASAKLSF